MKFGGLALLLLGGLSASELLAQMTTDQRLHDFQNLAALYAKRYAPYEWKRDAIGFDVYRLGPWLDRVRKVKDDLGFYEVCHEYVASLDDVHSSFRTPGSFVADLGVYVDIFDGKVVIEQVVRSRVPESDYPFQVGDELVALDRRSAEEWIAELSRFRKRGNPVTTRRAAADQITYRWQSAYPRAVEVGESAEVVVRRQNGATETYTIPWTKTGVGLRTVGPVPMPASAGKAAGRLAASGDVPDYMREMIEMRNWKLPEGDHLLRGGTWSEESGEEVPRRWVLGYGSRTPGFSQGFPPSFVQRLGRVSTDFHYSGSYESGGFKIGYLRIPNFSPPSTLSAVQELEREIDFFQENTDGLVVDVMRNTGGGCYMLDAAARLIPYPFYFFGEEIRVTQDRINSLQASIEAARRARADQWIIDTYQDRLGQLQRAYSENRGRTGAIPACTQWGQSSPPSFDNLPARVVYRKPIIVLIDDFSTSAADIFPAMLQDNRRGPLVGTRTNGGGGSTSAWPTGIYSEAVSSNTNTLVLRKDPVVTPEYPTAPYIENIGARADIQLDYMTKENLLNRGRPFVEAFTGILIDQIRAAKP